MAVRTYRFVDARLMPLNKWELPAQICGFVLAMHGSSVQGLLSQALQAYHVRMRFGRNCEVAVQSTMGMNAICPSQLIISSDVVYIDTMNTLTCRIVMVDAGE